jgi:hypothetical protein
MKGTRENSSFCSFFSRKVKKKGGVPFAPKNLNSLCGRTMNCDLLHNLVGNE